MLDIAMLNSSIVAMVMVVVVSGGRRC